MNISRLAFSVFLGITLIGLTGCAKKQRTSAKCFRSLSIGMTKEKVASVLGEPAMCRGAIQAKNGPLEVFEYHVEQEQIAAGKIAAHSLLSICTLGLWIPVAIAMECTGDYCYEKYFLYFSNDKLVQWGQPADWRKPADHVQEFRFR